MEPYRPLFSVDKPKSAADTGGEDRALAFLLIVLGALRVVPAIIRGEPFGAEATIAAIMLVLGGAMFARGTRWARRRLTRLPAARARRRRVRGR